MLRTFVALAVCLSTLAVAEQSPEVTRYLQASITLYENLEYGKALAQVQKARSKAKTSDDEARCSVLEAIVLADMGKDDKASKAFQEAFAIDPDLKLPVAVAPKIAAIADKAREQVKKLLAPTLAARAAEEAKKAAEEQAKLDAAKAEEDERKREALAQQQKDDDERKKAMQPPPAVVKSGGGLRSLAWVPGAVGLLSAGVATGLFVSASGRLNTLRTDTSLTPANALIARDAGKLDATLGWVFTGVAIAGLGGAAVMFLMGGAEASPTPAVSWFVTPHGGGVTWSGTFELLEVVR